MHRVSKYDGYCIVAVGTGSEQLKTLPQENQEGRYTVNYRAPPGYSVAYTTWHLQNHVTLFLAGQSIAKTSAVDVDTITNKSFSHNLVGYNKNIICYWTEMYHASSGIFPQVLGGRSINLTTPFHLSTKVKNECSYASNLYTCSYIHTNKLNLLLRATIPTYLPSVVDHHNSIYEKWFHVLRIIRSYFSCNCAIRVRNFEIDFLTKKFTVLWKTA